MGDAVEVLERNVAGADLLRIHVLDRNRHLSAASPAVFARKQRPDAVVDAIDPNDERLRRHATELSASSREDLSTNLIRVDLPRNDQDPPEPNGRKPVRPVRNPSWNCGRRHSRRWE